MLLYLDDDATIQGALVNLLRKAGHDVMLPAACGLSGADDPVHLTHAVKMGQPLLTYNHDDFEQLHFLVVATGGRHPGIVVIRRDDDKRDLKPHNIVAAWDKLIASGDPIPDHFTIFNQHR